MLNEEYISIIVPVYNTREDLLKRCFESITVQSYRNFEVIVVDDGSSEETASICDEYSKADCRFVVIHTQNEGVSVARNIGIERSKGKYIIFIDSDDFIDSQYIEILVKEAEYNNADCVVCGCKHIYNKNTENIKINKINYTAKTVSRDDLIDSLSYMKPLCKCIEITASWGKLYKREFMLDISFNHNMKIGEDYVFNYLYFKKIEKIICLDLELYNYLIHGQSVMHGKYHTEMIDTIYELENIISLEQNEERRDGVITRSLNIAMVLLAMLDMKEKPMEDYKKICRFITKYRWRVLFNPKAKIKIKVAILLSYVDFSIINRLMNRYSKNKLQKGIILI